MHRAGPGGGLRGLPLPGRLVDGAGDGDGAGVDVEVARPAVSAIVGLLLIVPIVTGFLPASWNDHAGKYLPARAGTAVFNVVPDPTSLSPWTGFTVLLGYVALALAAGGLLLSRNDA